MVIQVKKGDKTMKQKILDDINKIYKNGYVEYILNKYVNRDYWISNLKKAFPNNHIENLTDFNYSKCFTMCVNISEIDTNIGTDEFDKYIKTEGFLDRLQIQISILGPYATFKYIRYECIDNKNVYNDSYKPYIEKYSFVGDNVAELLYLNNLMLLDESILSIEVPDIVLELREENVTVYNCLFEDGY
jgi:hypothetical protein